MFKPGVSGNPTGRPRGWQSFAALVGPGTPKQIVDRIVKHALKGDPKESLTATCLKICVDRLWPTPRAAGEAHVTHTGVVEHRHETAEMAKFLTRSELKQIEVAAKAILKQSDETQTPTLN